VVQEREEEVCSGEAGEAVASERAAGGDSAAAVRRARRVCKSIDSCAPKPHICRHAVHVRQVAEA